MVFDKLYAVRMDYHYFCGCIICFNNVFHARRNLN
jgi:hypothetical protein